MLQTSEYKPAGMASKNNWGWVEKKDAQYQLWLRDKLQQ